MSSTPTFPPPGTPRISISIPSSFPPLPPSGPPSVTSSRAGSIDIPSTLSPISPTPRTKASRTRSALRSFYNLPGAPSTVSPFDSATFDASAHASHVLQTHGARELLALENTLIAEIRGLDGDRKALVYDNYSKLIDATETIRRMRRSMEPLTPTTRTMEPAVGHIEGVARSLCGKGNLSGTQAGSGGSGGGRKVVGWVLGAPELVRRLRERGKVVEARKIWTRAEEILEGWEKKGVRGVEEVREEGRKAMGGIEEK